MGSVLACLPGGRAATAPRRRSTLMQLKSRGEQWQEQAQQGQCRHVQQAEAVGPWELGVGPSPSKPAAAAVSTCPLRRFGCSTSRRGNGSRTAPRSPATRVGGKRVWGQARNQHSQLAFACLRDVCLPVEFCGLTCRCLPSCPAPPCPCADWVRDVAWAPNFGLPMNTLASAGQDGKVLIWTERQEGEQAAVV